jgi:hypothetical protein
MLSECNTTVDRYFREQVQHGTDCILISLGIVV